MELLKRSIIAAIVLSGGMALSACQTGMDSEPAGRVPPGETGDATQPGGTEPETSPGAGGASDGAASPSGPAEGSGSTQ